MLVDSSGSQLRLAGQTIGHPGRFVDNFDRGTSLHHSPLGIGWQDLGLLFPQAYDLTRIYNGAVVSGDPYWKGKNGATMAPDDDWENYNNYPGLSFGGVGGAIRNVGTGIYSYDVTTRISGILHGTGGPESEATPIVGVNTASDKLGYGAWLVNLTDSASPSFAWLVGYVANPPEDFVIIAVGAVTHTLDQERELTLKYRGTGFTVWLDGAQVTNLTTYPSGPALGSSLIPVAVEHQNQSWAGFEYDQHITVPSLMGTTPSVLSYSHQIVTA